MPKPSAKQYRTKNWKAYSVGLKSRGAPSIWLDKEMNRFAGSSGKCGRSATYSDAAIQFCLSLKCLFGLPLRRTMELIIASSNSVRWLRSLCRKSVWGKEELKPQMILATKHLAASVSVA